MPGTYGELSDQQVNLYYTESYEDFNYKQCNCIGASENYPSVNCCSCWVTINGEAINRCKERLSCNNLNYDNCKFDNEMINNANQKRIWKTVRVPSSMYTANKAGLFTFQKASPVYCNVNWNQMSDRSKPSKTTNNIPSRGNSTKYSLTRHRPGAASAPGLGVDVKHGSYERYLLKKKGKCVYKTQENPQIPVKGNKERKYGIAFSEQCIY